MPGETHKKGAKDVLLNADVACGSRKIKVTAFDPDTHIATVTLTKLKGETVEIREAAQADQPWIREDSGEGEMVEETYNIRVGTLEDRRQSQKMRVGSHRQFRVLYDRGDKFHIVFVGPGHEIT